MIESVCRDGGKQDADIRKQASNGDQRKQTNIAATPSPRAIGDGYLELQETTCFCLSNTICLSVFFNKTGRGIHKEVSGCS